MNRIKHALLITAATALPTVANAVPVDLSTWQAQGGSSNWQVQPGNDTVQQTVNGAPTIFFDPLSGGTQGTALNGKISVSDGDDDFIGFVLGYQSGEIFSSTADYYLVDWKKADQAGWDKGLAISHVTDGSNGNSDDTPGSFWQHTAGQVDLVTRASTLGDTGWVNSVEYAFNILFTSSQIAVTVNGSPQLNITPADVGVASFTDGSFGFYNLSQPNVTYSSITQVDCSVTPDAPECQVPEIPVPATLLLFGMGLLGLGWSRKRNV